MERVHVGDDIETRYLRSSAEERSEAAHRSESPEIGGEGASHEEAESDNLRPEEDRESTISANKHNSYHPPRAEEEDAPVGRHVIYDTSCGVELLC